MFDKYLSSITKKAKEAVKEETVKTIEQKLPTIIKTVGAIMLIAIFLPEPTKTQPAVNYAVTNNFYF